MSRRPRAVQEQRVARAIRRATASGHVIASSAPVVRPSRVTLGGVVSAAALAFWWPMDDASGNAVEAVSDAGSIVWHFGPPIYHADPLAPGSSYATGLSSDDATWGEASISSGLSAGSDGLIVIDWWWSGIEQDDGFTDITHLQLYRGEGEHFTVFGRHRGGSGNGFLEFWIDDNPNGVGDPVLSLSSWADPGHYTWEINPSTGAWRVLIGGALAGSGTHTVAWTSGAWALNVGGAAADAVTTVWDEIKIYGSRS